MNAWNNYKFDHTFSDLSKFDKFFVGADKFFNKVQETANFVANSAATAGYPPFNLKKTDDNVYVIEMAVAGFGKQDIELTLEDGILTVKGELKVDDKNDYIFKGIADRAFTRKFSLADSIEIKNADMINGMLRVWLERFIPENKKPRKIDINTPQETKKTFLAD